MPLGYYSFDDTNNARWAFFALFILALLFLLFYTLRVNKTRLRHGAKPIAGTAWITPPSYFQSQTQYNEPLNSTFVPPYSENALPNDAGYYDAHGNFIANPSYQPQKPPQFVSDVTGLSSTSPEYNPPDAPPPLHTRNTATGNTLNTETDVDYGYNRDFTNNNNNIVDEDDELHNFTRPTGPPPAHLTDSKH